LKEIYQPQKKTKPENDSVCFQVSGRKNCGKNSLPVHSMGIKWQWCGDTCTLTSSPMS